MRATVDPRMQGYTKTRPVQFYKPTRPQAPKYAKAPELADKVECSICRQLFLDDTKLAKDAHRRWHTVYGNTHMPCCEAEAAGASYHNLTLHCLSCSEDFCPCTDCYIQHTVECEHWAKAWALVDVDEAAAAAAMDAIVGARVA